MGKRDTHNEDVIEVELAIDNSARSDHLADLVPLL